MYILEFDAAPEKLVVGDESLAAVEDLRKYKVLNIPLEPHHDMNWSWALSGKDGEIYSEGV